MQALQQGEKISDLGRRVSNLEEALKLQISENEVLRGNNQGLRVLLTYVW